MYLLFTVCSLCITLWLQWLPFYFSCQKLHLSGVKSSVPISFMRLDSISLSNWYLLMRVHMISRQHIMSMAGRFGASMPPNGATLFMDGGEDLIFCVDQSLINCLQVFCATSIDNGGCHLAQNRQRLLWCGTFHRFYQWPSYTDEWLPSTSFHCCNGQLLHP